MFICFVNGPLSSGGNRPLLVIPHSPISGREGRRRAQLRASNGVCFHLRLRFLFVRASFVFHVLSRKRECRDGDTKQMRRQPDRERDFYLGIIIFEKGAYERSAFARFCAFESNVEAASR